MSVEKSKAEIEGVLRKYGATSFLSGYDEHKAFVLFQAHGRMVRFTVKIPQPSDAVFARDGRGSTRNQAARERAATAEEMRLWRCLLIAIKAKLEVVECGIESFEEAFLAQIVLPDGTTTGQWIAPQLDEAYRTAAMPSLMALGPGQ